MDEQLKSIDENSIDLENTVVDEEEFFERSLFDDVLEMKSLKQVSETTATDLGRLQDQVYQNLFKLFQKTRGLTTPDSSQDEAFGIFELFFKNYYQHFRLAMESLLETKSPVTVAYFLGKNTDKMISILDQVVKEIEKELC